MSPEHILAGSAAAVVVVLGVSAAVLVHDGRNRRLALRIAERVTPLAPARSPGRPLSEQIAFSTLAAAAVARLAGLCGFRPERQDAYPLPIPLLLLLLALPAFAIDRLLGSLLGFSLDLAVPVIWVGCCHALFRTLHARYAGKLYRQFPDVLAMIVRSVRAGIPLHEALRVVARESLEPTRTQFSRVVDQMTIGVRLEEALREAAMRTGVAEYAFFTVALTLQAQTGGSLAETLENLADVIRKRVALRLRAVALASEARTSAYVLAALPVVTGVVLSVINYDYLRPLFESRGGNRVLFAAITLLGLGGGSMRFLIKKKPAMTLAVASRLTPEALLLAAGALLTLLLALLALAWGPLKRERRLHRQLSQVRETYGLAGSAGGGLEAPVFLARTVGAVGSLLTGSGVLSPKAIANLESTLASAGFRGGRALPVFVGAKVLLLVGLPLLAMLVLGNTTLSANLSRLLVVAAAIAGLMLPDALLRGVRKRYLASVEAAMPDALDLLVICAEAGLALEQGMERVAREIRVSSPPCATELSLTHNELRILSDRRTALINMGKRTGLVSLQRLAGTLAQALQYGTPLSQALRSLAAELRAEALTRFEARAARLPVLMTLPMIMFILPCVFLVVAGPAVLAVIKAMSN